MKICEDCNVNPAFSDRAKRCVECAELHRIKAAEAVNAKYRKKRKEETNPDRELDLTNEYLRKPLIAR